MIVTSNLIKTPKVVTIDQNRWSRSVKFTGHDLLEWVVTVDQNTQFQSTLTAKPTRSLHGMTRYLACVNSKVVNTVWWASSNS